MKKIKIAELIIFLLISTYASAQEGVKLINLTCEYRNEPLGIDNPQPGLSWQIVTKNKNWVQNGYEILVAQSKELLGQDKGNVWESGKITSSESVCILYQGKALVPEKSYFWKVRVWYDNDKKSEWSGPATWTTGLFKSNDWNAKWISSRFVEAKNCHLQIPERETEYLRLPDNPDTAAVLMRKQFDLNKKPVRAMAFICGLGYYELYFNGSKVGDHVMDPNFTDYTVRVNYVTYDVTELVKPGTNVAGVILGNGFYNLPTPDLFQNEKACWKTAPKLLFHITIEYSDGTAQQLVSDGSWKWSTGEIVFNCVRAGETVDNRKAKIGWLKSGYDDSGWKPVAEVPAPFGKLSAQIMPPMRVKETLKPIKIWEPKKGIYVFDFGKNITGWPALKMKGKPGQELVLQCNEMLMKDSSIDMSYSHSHTFGRFQTEVFILGGKEEESFEPRFTYHGFRYVQISGLTTKPSMDCMVARNVHTDISGAGHFECSDIRLNQLQGAIRHTLLDCIHSMPGEEPTREKMGWTQDGQNTMDAYIYNFDALTSYINYLRDMTDAQEPSGHVPPIIPTDGWGYQQTNGKTIYCDDPWWGATLAVVANKLYSYYGNKRILEEAYLPMKRYVDYLSIMSDDHIITWSLGDWLDKTWKWPDGAGLTSVSFTSTAGYFYLAKMLGNNAGVLGNATDETKYSDLAESIKSTFNQKFLNKESGVYEKGSQSAQSLALYTGLVPEELINKAEIRLLEDIRNNDFHTTTGFIGVMPEMNYLGNISKTDVAYKMITQENSPGWFYMLKDENSTLGETLYKEQYGSDHHPFSSCVGSWLYVYLGGIRPDPVVPGFKKFLIKPEIVDELSWVKSIYQSLYGEIVSEWKKEKGILKMNISIPPNTTAEVYVPTHNTSSVKENGKPLKSSQFIIFLRTENNEAVYLMGSGNYQIESGL